MQVHYLHATVKRLVSAIACNSSVPYIVKSRQRGSSQTGELVKKMDLVPISSFPVFRLALVLGTLRLGILRLDIKIGNFQSLGVKSLLLLTTGPQLKINTTQHKLNLLRENSLIHLRCLQRPQVHRPRKNWTTGRRWQKS